MGVIFCPDKIRWVEIKHFDERTSLIKFISWEKVIPRCIMVVICNAEKRFNFLRLETVTKKMTLAKKWANDKKSTILVQ